MSDAPEEDHCAASWAMQETPFYYKIWGFLHGCCPMSECINLTLLRVYTGYIVTCMDWVFQCVIPSSCILQHIIASTCRRTCWQQRNFVKDVWGGNHATDCNGTASGGILFVSEVYGMHFTIPPNMSIWNWMWHLFRFFPLTQSWLLEISIRKDLPIDRHHDFVSTVSLAGDRFRVPWWRPRMGWPVVQCTNTYQFLYVISVISAYLSVSRSTYFTYLPVYFCVCRQHVSNCLFISICLFASLFFSRHL